MLYQVFISILLAVYSSTAISGYNEKAVPDLQTKIEPCKDLSNHSWATQHQRSQLDSLSTLITFHECHEASVILPFIDAVIAARMEQQFPVAEQMYQNMLAQSAGKKPGDHLKEEARSLYPLLPEEEVSKWEMTIENEDPELAADLYKFWKLRDPVLSTVENERLIEHWQRIAYARREFTKNKDSMYGTDDRGPIFIKYGPPSSKRSGMLTPESTEVRSKIYDLSFFRGNLNPRQIFNLNMSIKQNYMPQYYEVWVYRNMPSNRRVLYIFGESADRGSFGLRKSLEEFIPSGSFRMGISSSYSYGSGPRGISAGPFLQMGLYNKLSTVDIYFGKQLAYYDRNWTRYLKGDLNYSSLKMMNNSSRAEHELRRIQEQAPESQSTLQKNLDFIEQDYKIFRFLDENGEPENKVLVFSTPHEKLIPQDELMFQHEYPVYRLQTAARILDENAGQTHTDSRERMIEGDPSDTFITMLEIPGTEIKSGTELPTVLISSEISRIPVTGRNEIVPEHVIIASSIDRLSEMDGLKKERPFLAVSDILWGYKDEHPNHSIRELPFSIPVDQKIPEGRNLMLYFEAYHLEADNDDLHNYQMEYSIHRKKRRKIEDTGIKLTVNFSSRQSRSKERLEVETSGLEPGEYLVSCKFNTQDGVHTVIRTFNFKVGA